jgi:hypothetical protein
MNLYDQEPNETPFEWVNRVIKTIAYRLLWAVLVLFILGYLVGSVK